MLSTLEQLIGVGGVHLIFSPDLADGIFISGP